MDCAERCPEAQVRATSKVPVDHAVTAAQIFPFILAHLGQSRPQAAGCSASSVGAPQSAGSEATSGRPPPHLRQTTQAKTPQTQVGKAPEPLACVVRSPGAQPKSHFQKSLVLLFAFSSYWPNMETCERTYTWCHAAVTCTQPGLADCTLHSIIVLRNPSSKSRGLL